MCGAPYSSRRRKIHRRNGIERSLSRKELQAGLFGCKSRCQARYPTRPLSGISDFSGGKQFVEFIRHRLDEARYPLNFDGIHCAAIRELLFRHGSRQS
jgi:hypothetical protein